MNPDIQVIKPVSAYLSTHRTIVTVDDGCTAFTVEKWCSHDKGDNPGEYDDATGTSLPTYDLGSQRVNNGVESVEDNKEKILNEGAGLAVNLHFLWQLVE